MINAEQITGILSLYKKHGWKLRRVLLCVKSKENLSNEPVNLFGDAEIIESKVDAVWFSRPATDGNEAWELRHLSENPYALVEVFDSEDEEEVREEARTEIEARLTATLNLQ
jgi:hypothetical protein